MAIGMPFGYRFRVPLRVGGIDELPELGSEFPGVSAVGPGYFETAGTTIVRGRPFDTRDRAGSSPVAIVNETMADAVWPGDSPVGACLFIGPDATTCAEVVGVAENVLRGMSWSVVLVVLVGMLTVLWSGLEERRREMAVLRSVAARLLHVFLLILGEAFLLTLGDVDLGALMAVVRSLADGMSPEVGG